jgi:hypothetical protein
MKVKILAGEYLFSEQGLHVLDDRGFALKADTEIEVEVSDSKADQVKALIVADRANRGLDAEGAAIVVEELAPLEEPLEDENYFSEVQIEN